MDVGQGRRAEIVIVRPVGPIDGHVGAADDLLDTVGRPESGRQINPRVIGGGDYPVRPGIALDVVSAIPRAVKKSIVADATY